MCLESEKLDYKLANPRREKPIPGAHRLLLLFTEEVLSVLVWTEGYGLLKPVLNVVSEVAFPAERSGV